MHRAATTGSWMENDIPLLDIKINSRMWSEPTSTPATSADGDGLRTLKVSRYSRAEGTGVWYYQVDVTHGTEQDVVSNGPSYSVLRRYSDFRELYDQIEALITVAPASSAPTSPPPSFPEKEVFSSTLLGSLLWGSVVTTSPSVLKDRQHKFEQLLQWIERHPIVRDTTAFEEFIGQPPQTPEGYTSLRDYTAPHWLATLEQVAQGKQQQLQERRRRVYTMDKMQLEQLDNEQPSRQRAPTPPPSPPSLPRIVVGTTPIVTPAVLGKRRKNVDKSKTLSSAITKNNDNDNIRDIGIDASPPESTMSVVPLEGSSPQWKRSKTIRIDDEDDTPPSPQCSIEQ